MAECPTCGREISEDAFGFHVGFAHRHGAASSTVRDLGTVPDVAVVPYLADEQVREVDFTHGANVIAKSTSTVRHRPFTPVDYTRWLQRTVRMPTERRVSSATALYCALGGGVLVLVAVVVGISAFSSGQGGHQAGQSAVLVVALAVSGIVLLVVAAVMAVPRAVETAIGVGFSLATVRNLNSHRFGNAALNATAAEALHARSVERDAAQAYQRAQHDSDDDDYWTNVQKLPLDQQWEAALWFANALRTECRRRAESSGHYLSVPTYDEAVERLTARPERW